MLDFTVSDERCTRCGWCARGCPVDMIRQHGKELPTIAPEAEEQCLRCLHCLALCPTGAISIWGRSADTSRPLSPGRLPRLDQMISLLRGRRSVRLYLAENVNRPLLDQILASLDKSPTGVNQRELTFTVIDDGEVMRAFCGRAMRKLLIAARNNALPQGFDYLGRIAEVYSEGGRDIVFRGAPHAVIVSAAPEAACGTQDVVSALSYFELMAQSAGLGTVWCGLLWMVLEALPELKVVIGLPPNHIYYAMLFGYPDLRATRTMRRDDAARIRRVAL